jgi:hypothetical protein
MKSKLAAYSILDYQEGNPDQTCLVRTGSLRRNRAFPQGARKNWGDMKSYCNARRRQFSHEVKKHYFTINGINWSRVVGITWQVEPPVAQRSKDRKKLSFCVDWIMESIKVSSAKATTRPQP